MLKKILLVMCFLVLLSGAARAEVVSEVDDFDKTTYVYSHFRLPDIKEKGFELKNIIFRKRITANNAEYMLMFGNSRAGMHGESGFPAYNDFLVKFDNNDNEIYTLPRKADFFSSWPGGWGGIGGSGFHQIFLSLPANVVDKILSSNKITLRIPLYPGDIGYPYKTTIRNIILDIPEDIINEWRQVIQSQ